MVLDYFGQAYSEKAIAKHCRRDQTLGTKDVDLMRAARLYGFRVFKKNNANFRDLRKWLLKGVPVIVNWFTRGRSDYEDSAVPDGHYSVVVGLDEKYIYLQDPEIGGLRKIERDDFLRVWFDFTGHHIRANQLVVRQFIAVYGK